MKHRALIFLSLVMGFAFPMRATAPVQFGVDCLVDYLDNKKTLDLRMPGRFPWDQGEYFKDWLMQQRIGIISNTSARLNDGSTCVEEALSQRLPITSYFYLEHGRNSKEEASVAIASVGNRFSLYGSEAQLSPAFEMLDTVTTVIYCVPDVGSRCYTYAGSLFYFMDAIKAYQEKTGKKMTLIVLDRPNPISFCVDGVVREEAWQSLMGFLPVPFCHGLTVGEQALFYNKQQKVLRDAQLIVVPVKNWSRNQGFENLKWVATSPNMRTLETLYAYPITVLAEGFDFFNLGRGEAHPFCYWVADWITDGEVLAEKLNTRCKELGLAGVQFSAYTITPQQRPMTGKRCEGFFVHVKDPRLYKPIATQYVLLEVLQNHYGKNFTDRIKVLQDKRNSTNKDGLADKPLNTHRGKVLSYYHQACWLMGTEKFLEQLIDGRFDAPSAIHEANLDCERFKKEVQDLLIY